MKPSVNVIHNLLGDTDEAQNVDNDTRESRKKAVKQGAVSFANFLYWTNFVGVLFLLIGFIAPGWLTVKSEQVIFTDYQEVYRQFVFQDYSLWYITQCTGEKLVCDTMTYRLTDAVSDETCETCDFLHINFFRTNTFMFFSGAGIASFLLLGFSAYTVTPEPAMKDAVFFRSSILPCTLILIGVRFGNTLFLWFSGESCRAFSYGECVCAQVLYTLGVLIAMIMLSELRAFRKNVAEDKDVKMSKKKWIFLLALGALCFCFVFIPTFMFVLVHIRIGQGVRMPVGSVLAGVGGITMIVVTCTIVLQLELACCCNAEEGVYL